MTEAANRLARVEDEGDRLLVVASNAARRNALSPDFYAALGDGLARAAEPRIGAVIVHGAGGYFCAGGDLRSLRERRGLPFDERRARIETLHDLVRAIRACPVPVIAAVDGGAAGAGVSIAFACDLVVAASDATFSAAYVKAGLVPDGGLTATLAAHLPRPMLMRMALFGEPVEATRLRDLGAVSAICEPGGALAAANALADRLLAGPPEATARIKALVRAAYATPPDAQMDAERDAMAAALGGAEAGEGIDAFLNKRRPDFAARRQV